MAMKKRITYILLLFAVSTFYSCSSKYLVNGGSNDYENLRYADAIDKFKSALEKDPENEDALKMLAKSYQTTHKYSDAKSIMNCMWEKEMPNLLINSTMLKCL